MLQNRRWITVRDCADYLGLHEVTVRRLIDKGEIPAGRIGRNIRIDRKKLERVLEQERGREQN